MLKKPIIAIIIAFLLINFINGLAVPFIKTSAENGNYYRILKDDVYLYSDSKCTDKVFKLPYGYFVKVTDFSSPYCKVTCYYSDTGSELIDGYTYAENLTFFEGTPIQAYLNLNVTLNTSAVIYADSDKSQILRNVFSGRNMTYFGEIISTDNTVLCFARYDNTFGYVEKNKFISFTVPTSSDAFPKTEQPQSEIQTNDEVQPVKPNGLKIAIIVIMSLALLAVIVSFFIKPDKTNEYVTEE